MIGYLITMQKQKQCWQKNSIDVEQKYLEKAS